MHDLFGRLQTKRKSVIAKRHIQILNLLLQQDEVPLPDVFTMTEHIYKNLKASGKARMRDLIHLLNVGAVTMRSEKISEKEYKNFMSVNLDWPKEITQSGFMERAKKLPRAKEYAFLSAGN